MKTWSLADVIDRATIAFVDAASLGAVVVQGVLDALSPPHFQPVGDPHPIPGCPRPVECRTHGCAGNCSEALEYEAEEECSEPRLNDGLTPFDPQWKMTVAGNKRCIDCMAPAHWNAGLESWYHDYDGSDVCLINQPDVRCLVIDDYVPICCRPGGRCTPESSLAVSADVRDSAAESCSTPRSTSAACTDPSPTGDEGPDSVSGIPKPPESGHPEPRAYREAAIERVEELATGYRQTLLETYGLTPKHQK